MALPHFSRAYEHWAPVAVRVIFGFVFLLSAYYKIPGTESFNMQVGMSGAVGIPLPLIAVTAAFILEVVGGVALIIGWHTRTVAVALAAFVLLIGAFFYRDWSDQVTFGYFMSCLTQAAGLIYVSVYGAQTAAYERDPLPHGMHRDHTSADRTEQIEPIDLKDYAKFVLRDGSVLEQRSVLECISSELVLKSGRITMKE